MTHYILFPIIVLTDIITIASFGIFNKVRLFEGENMITINTGVEQPLPYYLQIYQAVRRDIEKGIIAPGEKLPSKRRLAADLKVSQTTVESAYAQLKAEGYIYAKDKSGYYAEDILKYGKVRGESPGWGCETPVPSLSPEEKKEYRYDFETGGVNIEYFPFSLWARLIRETLREDKENLLKVTHPQGLYELRGEICRILRVNRGIDPCPEQVIVGAGWEYLLTLIVQLLGRDKSYGVEEPGYPKVPRILEKMGGSTIPLEVDSQGVKTQALYDSGAEIIHVTPSHHFPLGVVTSAKRRGELLEWAGGSPDRYIIEDDYDSEFRLYGRPIPSIYGMDGGGKVIYIKTFARSLAPSLRMAYMVLPLELMQKYHEELCFYGSTVPRMEQHVLTRFIAGGHLQRHLNRMNTVYRKNSRIFLDTIKNSCLGPRINIFKDDGGTRVLFKVEGLTEGELVRKAAEAGIKINGISQYYTGKIPPQYCDTVVAGFSGFSEAQLIPAVEGLVEAWSH